ncbi:hypothetical protein HZC00_04595 [Candidatus Kaiserbacteria bacterium]|nr:hypothetical protein [Candidatus Kaiserbacteria bacterium]
MPDKRPCLAHIDTGIGPLDKIIGVVDEGSRKLLIKYYEVWGEATRVAEEADALSDPILAENKLGEAEYLATTANPLKEAFWVYVYRQFPDVTTKNVDLRDDWLVIIHTKVPVLVLDLGNTESADTSDQEEIPDRSRMN